MKTDMNIKNELSNTQLDSKAFDRKKSISRFIITSGLVHLVTASAILITNHVPKNEVEAEKEFVMIDFSVPTDSNSAPEEAILPEVVAKTAIPVEAPQDEENAVVDESETEPATPVAETPAIEEKVPAPVVAKEIPKPAKPVQSNPIPVVKQAPPKAAEKAPVAATVSDIETPTLDESAVPIKVAKTQNELKPEDLDQDLTKVDEQHEQKLQAVKNELEENTNEAENSIDKATDTATEEIQKENEAVAAQIKERSEALRKEEAAKALAASEALAQKQAADKALAQKLAAEKAEADKLAAEKNQAGTGQKDAGPGTVSTEVRALEQLRQMPGNPKPQYESEERLRGDKGVVVFQAYVSPTGALNDFKLLQSTGHRNLDAKTLKALKQWKFYPGQEGWVELPFDWNLKGGPQEMPAFLRRKTSKRL